MFYHCVPEMISSYAGAKCLQKDLPSSLKMPLTPQFLRYAGRNARQPFF